MEAARSFETLVSYHFTILCHNPEDNDLNLHHRENVKSRNKVSLVSNYITDILSFMKIHQCGRTLLRVKRVHISTQMSDNYKHTFPWNER